MPRIPRIDYTTRAPGPVDQAKATPTNVGAHLAAFGQSITELGGQLKDDYDQSEAQKFTADAQKRLQDAAYRIQNGGVDEDGNKIDPLPPEVHQQNFEQEMYNIRQDAEEKIGSSRAFRMFDTNFNEFAQRQKLQVMQGANDLYKARIKNNLMEVLDMQSNAMGSASSPLEKITIQDQSMKAIAAAEAKGLITPEASFSLKKNFLKNAAMTDYLKIVKTNPMDAVEAIDKGEFDDALDSEARATLRNRAIAESETQIKANNLLQEKIERDQAKLEKNSQDMTAKEGWALRAQGKLTPRWVMDRQDSLSKDDFKMLLGTAAGGDDVPTNKTVYSNLRLRAGRGEDVTEEATNAYKRGMFARDPYEKLLAEVETNSAGAEIKGVYKLGQKYLATSLVPDPNNPAWSDLVAQTMDDWRSWAAENPSATQEQAEKVYRRYAEDARLVGFQNTVIGNVVPMYYPGGAAAARTLPTRESLNEAFRQTKEAFDKKEISPFEKRRQFRIIDSWRSFVKDTEPKASTGVTNGQ